MVAAEDETILRNDIYIIDGDSNTLAVNHAIDRMAIFRPQSLIVLLWLVENTILFVVEDCDED